MGKAGRDRPGAKGRSADVANAAGRRDTCSLGGARVRRTAVARSARRQLDPGAVSPSTSWSFRNLGFSGDEVATRLRSKNFGTPDEWLSGLAPIGGYEDNRFDGTNTKADVIFAFFGYNESFAGEAGLDDVQEGPRPT